jgi:hypothetical protein
MVGMRSCRKSRCEAGVTHLREDPLLELGLAPLERDLRERRDGGGEAERGQRQVDRRERAAGVCGRALVAIADRRGGDLARGDTVIFGIT